ncbi:GapA-binding peptide SR1P [Pseudogracilibacillus sp. SO30301A]
MGIIICQQCQEVINYYEEEKVTKLYSTCPNCNNKKKKSK